MTVEEKRDYVQAFCRMRSCNDKCAIKRLNDATGVRVCYTDATEEQLDERIELIKKEKDAGLVTPAMKKVKLERLCEEQSTCGSCPCGGLADHKHDGICDFEEFSEEDIDEYLKNFTAEAEVKREFTKVAPPTETSLKDAIHPHHYKLPGGMQVVDVEVAMFGREAVMAHCLCTAAEYILRSRQKNGVEDIKKAHWWLCEYLELEAEGHGK